MYIFKDVHDYNVCLAFQTDAFDLTPGHVIVICEYEGQWLLTQHKKRGLEFPGGKREKGETLEETAKREVSEETGGILEDLVVLGEYKVMDPIKPFVKRIYYGKINNIRKNEDYYETAGPVLVPEFTNIKNDPSYSFIMKDEVISKSIEEINRLKKAGIVK